MMESDGSEGTERKVSKCTEVCRTYSKIQSAYVDILEQDDSIISFECNVLLEGVEGNQYSSDFMAKKADGSTIIRECVWRFNLNKLMTSPEKPSSRFVPTAADLVRA